MSVNEDRYLTFHEIIEKVLRRVGNSNKLSGLLYEQLFDEFDTLPIEPPENWQEIKTKPEDVRTLYATTMQRLEEIAVECADNADDSTYDEATTLGQALCTVLNEAYDLDLPARQIVPPSQ